MLSKKRNGRAVVVAATVEVLCPECGAEQPCVDNGSDLWPIEELREADGRKFECVSCDNKFQLMVDHKVNLP